MRLVTFLLCALGALSLASCGTPADVPAEAVGEPPRLIGRGELLAGDSPSAVRMSPDGERLVFVAAAAERAEEAMSLWLAPTADPATAREVAIDENGALEILGWSADSARVIYGVAQADGARRLYALDVRSRGLQVLNPAGTHGELVAISRQRPSAALIAVNARDPRWLDLHRVELASGKRELVERNDRLVGFGVDHDWDLRIGFEATVDGGLKMLQRGEDGDWTELSHMNAADALGTRWLGFGPSSEVVYVTDAREREMPALVALRLTSGKSRVVAEDRRAAPSEWLRDPIDASVQAVAATRAGQHWSVIDEAVRADLDHLRALGDGVLEVIDRTRDDRRWLIALAPPAAARRHYLYERGDSGDEGTTTELVLGDHTTPPAESLVAAHAVEIEARDGLRLLGRLTLPAEMDGNRDGRPAHPLPLVLLVRDDPWSRESPAMNPAHQWLANRGYAVLSVDFRGTLGLGSALHRAGHGEWGAGMHEDLIDAVRWAIRERVAVADQVAIMGAGYGGFAALTGLARTPETFACGVAVAPPSDLENWLDTLPPHAAAHAGLWHSWVGDPGTRAGREQLAERSPISHAEKIERPVLIAQGALDPRVSLAATERFVQAVSSTVPVTYLVFPDEVGRPLRPGNRLALAAIAESFLGDCLGGRVEPIGDSLVDSAVRVAAGGEFIHGLPERVAKR